MDPGLEAIGLPQARQLAPGRDEGDLQGVLGEVRVAQDPMGHREQRVAHLMHQACEGVAITLPGLLDQLPLPFIDPSGGWPRRRSARLTHYEWWRKPERSAGTNEAPARVAAHRGT